jgi:hypothetical protein
MKEAYLMTTKMSAVPDPDDDKGGDEPINPFDLDNVRYADAEFSHGDIDTDKTTTAIAVRKPHSLKEWFRVHPGRDFTVSASLYERQDPESTRPELWLVPKPLRWMFREKALTPVVLRLAVTSLDSPYLWPVKQARKGQRDAYHRSLDQVVESAETTWTMVEWNNTTRAYDFYPAPDDLGDPRFPSDLTMLQLLELAFNGRAIDRRDHPVILEHQGKLGNGE